MFNLLVVLCVVVVGELCLFWEIYSCYRKGKFFIFLMLIFCRMLVDFLMESFYLVNGRKYLIGFCCLF